MSLFYGTDEKIIKGEELKGHTSHPTQMKWHRLLDICREKGVSDGHYRTYMDSNSSAFGETEVFLYDCMKKDVLKVAVQNFDPKSKQQIYGEDGEELENDPDELELGPEDQSAKRKYIYSIDTENKSCKKMFKNYVKAQLDKFTDASVSYGDVMEGIKAELLKYGEIAGLSNYFNQIENEYSKEFVLVYNNATHNAYQKSNGFDVEIEKNFRNNLDSEKQTKMLKDTIDGIKKTPHLNDAKNRAQKESCGDVLMDELQNEVRLHRGHSILFIVFHPVKYYREGKSITDAKQALVDLGADEKKVDALVENTKLEDKYLRSKNDIAKAKTVREVYLGRKFEDLQSGIEVNEVDDLIMDDDESVVEEFVEQVANAVEKSEQPLVKAQEDKKPVEEVAEDKKSVENDAPVEDKAEVL